MQEILFNLALIDAINYCHQEGVSPSGSHLVKDGRGYTYSLLRTATGKKIVSVTFHKNQTPKHTLWVYEDGGHA